MKIKVSLLWGGAIILSVIACQNAGGSKATSDQQATTVDTTIKSFKTEYESVNGTKSKSGKTYIDIHIDSDSSIIYSTEEDILKLENGIVLFGFPTCPWCRNTIEPLLDFAREENVKIHYLNILKIRDQKELKADSTTIVTTNEGTAGYRAILKKFDEVLDPYKELGNDSIKRIVSSTVLFIKDNKAFEKKSGTVESQKNAYVKLTPEQHKELKQIYKDIYSRYKQEGK